MTDFYPGAGGETDELVGRLVSERYQVLRRLGEGSMGVVYLAEHTLMKKQVALKVMRPDLIENEEAVERFQREAQAAANIEHPNVCAATDIGWLDDEALFLVMEYLDGRPLDEVLIAEGPLDADRAVHIARQIAEALERAHALEIIHRDLKPENILLVERDGDPDFVKITDFGVARVRLGGAQKLTQAGTTYGTPSYMSPEQAGGREIDTRSDLYALGIIMYEMLTGTVPFSGSSIAIILSKHLSEEPEPLQDRAPPGTLIPGALAQIVRCLLEKLPELRFQTAREVIEALDAYEAGEAPDQDSLHTAAMPAVAIAEASPAAQANAPAPRSEAPAPAPDAEPITEEPIAEEPITEGPITEGPTPPAPPSEASEEPAPSTPPAVPNAPKPSPGHAEPAPASLSAELVVREAASRFGALSPRKRMALIAGLLVMMLVPVVGGITLASLLLSDAPREQSAQAEAESGPATLADERQSFLEEEEELAAAVALIASDASKASKTLEGLAEEHAESPHFHFFVGSAELAAGDAASAFSKFLQAIEQDPRYAEDEEVVAPAVERLASEGEEGEEGEVAARFVRTLLTRKPPSKAALAATADRALEDDTWKTRKQTRKLLQDAGVYESLPEWQRTAIDLRLTGRDCEAVKRRVRKLRELGDVRAVPALESVSKRPRKGCGFLERQDCYACVRGDISATLSELQKKPAP